MSIGIFHQAQSGIQSGLARGDQAAHQIASQVTRSSNQDETLTQRASPEISSNEAKPSITDSLVDLKEAKLEVAANAKVIQQGDEMLGRIIDVFA